jgi:hypothetical protein
MRAISRWLSVVVLLTGLLIAMQTAAAQDHLPLPTIITFTGTIETITLADAEAGQSETTLFWHAAGLRDGHTLTLYSYRLAQWVALNEEPLPATGTLQIRVEHSLTFAPPTYRLVIHAADGRMLDERMLIIPYAVADQGDPPAIETFLADVTQVDADALSRGTAQVRVLWNVRNRPATANLTFAQALGADEFVPVELARWNRWVSSAGQGPVAPVLPPGEDTLRLRLQLVDLVDGHIYDEQTVAIPIVGQPVTPPQPRPPVSPTIPPTAPPDETHSQAEIVSFTAAPEMVDRGGQVTLRWEVRGAREQTVWRLNPIGQVADWLEDTPAVGSWTVTLQDYYVDFAMFQLWAIDAEENNVSQTVTVRVRCPYTYFFGQPEGASCPLGEARQIAAAAQRFEHGIMIWRSDWGSIYVLYDGNRLERYQDTWQPGETFADDPPPAGLVQPVRGFGKVWATYPGVRAALGWAVEPEQGYTMQVQTSGAYKYASTYFTLPDGRVVGIVENTWRFVDG